MQYQEIKKKRQDDHDKLFSDLKVFWAFSDSQFKEGLAKTKLQEGEKLVSIGAGGFILKQNAQALIDGMKAIEDTFKAQIKEAKARTEHILYELNNHEAFYTGTIESTLEALGEDYTSEEVEAIYKDYKAKNRSRGLSMQELKQKYA
jgi:hypothetical protein